MNLYWEWYYPLWCLCTNLWLVGGLRRAYLQGVEDGQIYDLEGDDP